MSELTISTGKLPSPAPHSVSQALLSPESLCLGSPSPHTDLPMGGRGPPTFHYPWDHPKGCLRTRDHFILLLTKGLPPSAFRDKMSMSSLLSSWEIPQGMSSSFKATSPLHTRTGLVYLRPCMMVFNPSSRNTCRSCQNCTSEYSRSYYVQSNTTTAFSFITFSLLWVHSGFLEVAWILLLKTKCRNINENLITFI